MYPQFIQLETRMWNLIAAHEAARLAARSGPRRFRLRRR